MNETSALQAVGKLAFELSGADDYTALDNEISDRLYKILDANTRRGTIDEYIEKRLAATSNAIGTYQKRAAFDRDCIKFAAAYIEKQKAKERYAETLGTLRWLQGRQAEIIQFEREYNGTIER